MATPAMSEVIQSSSINFLLGAGVSTPFLPLLGNIETKLNAAKNESEREIELKKYFEGVMIPNKQIIDNTASGDDYEKTKSNYENFFIAIAKMLAKRKSTILSKQVNIFTTNIDIFTEKTLEFLALEYNDGFSGRFDPVFTPSNFKKSVEQRSMHYDHTSEIPTFNIIKIHGSLTWYNRDQKIYFSHKLGHFDKSLKSKSGKEFKEGYQKILVVNPQESKHLESVLNLYYSELLRMFSSELEKENAALYVLGFSMEDKHIREITLRSAKANPTLQIFICCSVGCVEEMKNKMETQQHLNIHILPAHEGFEMYTLECFTKNVLEDLTK